MKKSKRYKPLNQIIIFSSGEIQNIDNLISKGIVENFDINKGFNSHTEIRELDYFLSVMNIFYQCKLIKTKYTHVTRIFLYDEKELIFPAIICNGIIYKLNNNYSKIPYYKRRADKLIWMIKSSCILHDLIKGYSCCLKKDSKTIANESLLNQLTVCKQLKELMTNLFSAYCKEFQIYPIP